jgi:hypothetical protein
LDDDSCGGCNDHLRNIHTVLLTGQSIPHQHDFVGYFHVVRRVLCELHLRCDFYNIRQIDSDHSCSHDLRYVWFYVVLVLACTLYAFTTQTDFTTSWGIIIVLMSAMFCLAIVSIFTSSPFINNLYCAIGVILFGLYLIIDTQMLLGGRTIQLSVDDYVLASFCLYIDIIQIFLYLLQLLKNNND